MLQVCICHYVQRSAPGCSASCDLPHTGGLVVLRRGCAFGAWSDQIPASSVPALWLLQLRGLQGRCIADGTTTSWPTKTRPFTICPTLDSLSVSGRPCISTYTYIHPVTPHRQGNSSVVLNRPFQRAPVEGALMLSLLSLLVGRDSPAGVGVIDERFVLFWCCVGHGRACLRWRFAQKHIA